MQSLEKALPWDRKKKHRKELSGALPHQLGGGPGDFVFWFFVGFGPKCPNGSIACKGFSQAEPAFTCTCAIWEREAHNKMQKGQEKWGRNPIMEALEYRYGRGNRLHRPSTCLRQPSRYSYPCARSSSWVALMSCNQTDGSLGAYCHCPCRSAQTWWSCAILA